MVQYGRFPGVKVDTERGGVTSVSIGSEEKVVLFGEASYAYDSGEIVVEGDDSSLDVTAESPETINAPGVADQKFGSGSELADAMKEARANGADRNFLHGVPVGRDFVEAENTSGSGTLTNYEIVENLGGSVDSNNDNLNDMGVTATADPDGTPTDMTVEFRYDGAPSQPSDSDTVFLNPLTGQFEADSGTTDIDWDYTYNEYLSAINAAEPANVIEEDETGIWMVMSESNNLSSDLESIVADLRDDYQLVNALQFAEPYGNDTVSEPRGADPEYNMLTYTSNANHPGARAEHFYKFAPARLNNVSKTIGGGIAGLFAGNDISDPIYNEAVEGYGALEQKLTRTEAEDLRVGDPGDPNNIIPVRSGGTTRVKGNRSLALDTDSTTVAGKDIAADFWTRRITDRVILIVKIIGDRVIGQINDEESRNAAERAIESQMRQLASQRLIRNNADEQNWAVQVYPDENNRNEVNIDIGFSPYGVIKRVDTTVTVDTTV